MGTAVIKANLPVRLFLKKKVFKLALIGFNVWIISLIFFFSVFLLTVLNDHLMVRHLGAIPSVTVQFKDPLASEQMQNLIEQINAHIDTDAIRAGYQISTPVTISWVKGDQMVTTAFDMVFVGWDLRYSYRLLVSDGVRQRTISCLKMHPAYGFYIPAHELKGLGSKITVEKAWVENFLSYEVPLNLNVQKRSKVETLNNIPCRRLVLPLPKKMASQKEEEDFRKREEQFYASITRCLSRPLGAKLYKTMTDNLRHTIFKLLSGENMCIPSIQIWEDMCGTGVVDRAAYKEIDFAINGSVNVHQLNTHGFLRTRYKSSENGYRTYLDIDQLQRLLNTTQLTGRNILELEIPRCMPGSPNYLRLQEIVKNHTQASGVIVFPWWERIEARMVDLIFHSIKHVKGISLMILFFSFIGLYHLCLRFSSEIKKEWALTATFFGGKTVIIGLGVAAYCLLVLVGSGLAFGAVVCLGQIAAADIVAAYAQELPYLYAVVMSGTALAALTMILFTFAKSFGSIRGILSIIIVVTGVCLVSMISGADLVHYSQLIFIPLALFISVDGLIYLFYQASTRSSSNDNHHVRFRPW